MHRQRDRAEAGHVVGVVLAHHLDGALHDPVDAGGAHHHVVRLFLEHELTRARQRVERRLLQRAELVLAVPVGEVGEHEERQPVRGLLVERAQDPRRVLAAGVAVQQLLGLLPALPAEVGVQQVDHRPQVPALLDVDLEQVAQVVQARRGGAQVALLLDRGRLGVALDHDQPLQLRRGTPPAPCPTPARPCARRTRPCGPGPARPGRCPSGSPAWARARTAPSRRGRR